ncbi:hypothetical protein [Streptomyces rimosus]|uniref:hypothetical protein n=1 Tax=Streptomyces rimosus TaxID=1927 RepID=UPI0004CB2635|nr:hypothetical protein [Streptomyces rimosus]
MNDLSRRRVLGTLAGAAALGLPALTPATAAAAPLRADQALRTDQPATTWRGPRSANGWKILDEAETHPIEGSGQSVRLTGGDAHLRGCDGSRILSGANLVPGISKDGGSDDRMGVITQGLSLTSVAGTDSSKPILDASCIQVRRSAPMMPV